MRKRSMTVSLEEWRFKHSGAPSRTRTQRTIYQARREKITSLSVTTLLLMVPANVSAGPPVSPGHAGAKVRAGMNDPKLSLTLHPSTWLITHERN